MIDRETPDYVLEIDTPKVLRLVSADLRDFVWGNLCSQLAIARGFGQQTPGVVLSEDKARAGAITVAWLTEELTRGFPDRARLLPASVTAVEPVDFEVPDDAGELVEGRTGAQPPALRSGPDAGSHGRLRSVRAPTDLSDFGWDRETGASTNDLGIGEVLS